jgi:hydroxyethylthiazole kinase-like uncharacterized protein yjeF
MLMAMLVTCDEMRAREAAAVASGLSEDSLMEAAGRRLAELVRELVPEPSAVVVVAGKGHNAGDALVAARHWMDWGWPVIVEACFPESEWRPLMREKWRLVAGRLDSEIPQTGRLVVVDGLLGIGGDFCLRPPVLSGCQRIHQLQRERSATVVAVDGPSGLDFDGGHADAHAVRADLTVTIGAVKRGLLADGAIDHVGRLAVAAVPGLSGGLDEMPGLEEVLTPCRVRARLPEPRPFDFHKGQAGRVLVVAGSRGFLGAARLCAAAAVHGGAGLVTLAVPKGLQDVAAASVCPEVMVYGYRDWPELLELPANVLAVGPGLGRRDDGGLVAWLAGDGRPAVLDADALNALAAEAQGPSRTAAIAAIGRPDRLLTPHPGEMRRLLEAWQPSWLELPRAAQVRHGVETWGCSVLLKGARSLAGAPGHPLAYNTTGHPAMASGGMGDVLTGLTAALIAQGVTAHASACLGSWLLGRAAELALARHLASPESLRASLVTEMLGSAFDALRFGSE